MFKVPNVNCKRMSLWNTSVQQGSYQIMISDKEETGMVHAVSFVNSVSCCFFFLSDSPSDWWPDPSQHNSGWVCPLPDHTFPEHRATGPQNPFSPTPVGGVSCSATTARHTAREQVSQDYRATAEQLGDQRSPLWWDRFHGQPEGCGGWCKQCRQRWHSYCVVICCSHLLAACLDGLCGTVLSFLTHCLVKGRCFAPMLVTEWCDCEWRGWSGHTCALTQKTHLLIQLHNKVKGWGLGMGGGEVYWNHCIRPSICPFVHLRMCLDFVWTKYSELLYFWYPNLVWWCVIMSWMVRLI